MSVSVVIPAHNAEASIATAVHSVQGLVDEVIVVDDGSTDQTAHVAREAGAQVITQENQGAAMARDTGVLATRQDLVILLDADDEVIAEGARESIRILRDHPKVSVAGGRVIHLLPRGKVRTTALLPPRIDAASMLDDGYSPWPPGGAVVRTQAYRDAMKIEPARLQPADAEDYEMFLRLAMVGEIFTHPAPTLRYRKYIGVSSRSNTKPLFDKERVRSYYAEWLGHDVKLLRPRHLRAAVLMRGARVDMAHGRPVRAIAAVMVAAGLRPVMAVSGTARAVRGGSIGSMFRSA